MFANILPDNEAQSCTHRHNDPNCCCASAECPECGAEYVPAEGHCCLDGNDADEVKTEALELLEDYEKLNDEYKRLVALHKEAKQVLTRLGYEATETFPGGLKHWAKKG